MDFVIRQGLIWRTLINVADLSIYSKTNQMHQCLKFILFLNDTLHVSDGLSVHHQQFKIVHTATVICQTDIAC